MSNWTERHAIDYDEKWGELNFHKKIPYMVGIEEGQSILEIGCGGGFLAICLAQTVQSVNVFAIDPTKKMIDRAKQRQQKADLGTSRIQFLQVGAETSVTDEASIDQVIAAFSVHHWRQPKLAMQVTFQQLKPGGRIWICEDLNTPIEGDLEVETSLKNFEGIKALLESSGFVSVTQALDTSDEGEFLIVEAVKL